jgi:hypothetical protein
VKRILMIAYHFPPLSGSSGIQRTLRFVQHLPALGWQPLVLSAEPRAYEKTSDDLMGQIPAATPVRRAFALDTARHLSIAGRYMGWMARPDRWVSWKFDAVRCGLQMSHEFKPDVIWSTYPIATAHLIGAALHRKTGIPWVADFRDPMAQDGYPADPQTWRSYQRIEEQAVSRACLSVFTTPGAARTYCTRYPASAERIVVVENGYDEESFASAALSNESAVLDTGTIILLHSGIVYPEERDPRPLFVAIRRLVIAGKLKPGDMRIRFRAAAHDAMLLSMAAEIGVSDFIEVASPISYVEALREMTRVHGLLVLQSNDCNDQIPAKIYEYLRAGRPILGLTDPAGDTAGVLREAGIDAIARLDSAEEIEALLPQFLQALKTKTASAASPVAIARASRKGRAESLATLLNKCI